MTDSMAAPGPEETAERRRFEAAVAARGLMLSTEERDSVFQLASWMRDGVAQLPQTLPDIRQPEPPAATEDPTELSIAETGRRLRDGRLTATALLEAHLARIAERDGHYRAFHHLAAAQALDAARRADAELAAGRDRGPLHGIPIGIKDLIDVAGLPTTAGSHSRKSHRADDDATVVARLREAGAIILGKLATYEFGTVGPAYDTLFPPARNPWSLEHITGGSSSGSAAAVAGGLLRTTLGTDTGGSVRGPSSYCGTVGLKPTFGSVPIDGTVPLSPSLDHVGPISATVAEAALTLDAICAQGQGATRLLGQPIEGLRIAYARNWFASDNQAMPAAVAAMDAAVSHLSLLGAVIEEVELPDYFAVEVAAAAILQYEALKIHGRALAETPDGFGRKTYQSLACGVALSEAEYVAARRAGSAFRAALDRDVFDRFDALVTICALTTALPVALFDKGAVWTPMRTIGFNVSGHPVLAMPMGFANGLPLGMQIVGRHHDEARIVQIGDAYEQATDHAVQRPPRPNA